MCVCVCVCVCVCTCALPCGLPVLCATAWQIYITELTCWRAGGAKKITIDIAMVTVTLLFPATHSAVCVCVCVCVCVWGERGDCCFLVGGWMFFSRGIAGDTTGRWQGLQPQPVVNNTAMLLASVQRSLCISEWLPRQLGAESGPNFVLDSLRQMSCWACWGELFMCVCVVQKKRNL